MSDHKVIHGVGDVNQRINNQNDLLLSDNGLINNDKEKSINRDSLHLESLARYKKLKSLGCRLHGDCGSDGTIKPAWFNQALFDQGKLLGQKYFFSAFFGHLCGVYILVQVPSIYETLLTTGASRTVSSLFSRYLATLNHVKVWYDGDVWNPSDPGYKSILAVRKGHKIVSSRLNQGKLEGKDILALNQFDMFLTLWAFVGNTFLRPKETGFPDDGDNMKAWLHFWRSIGYLMGVQDEYNICNDDNMDQATSMIELVWDREFKPILIDHLNAEVSENGTSDKGRIMCDSIIDSMNPLLPILSTPAFVKYFHEMHLLKSPVTLETLHAKMSHTFMKVTMANILPSYFAQSICNFFLNRSLRQCNKDEAKIKQSLEGIGPVNEPDKHDDKTSTNAIVSDAYINEIDR